MQRCAVFCSDSALSAGPHPTRVCPLYTHHPAHLPHRVPRHHPHPVAAVCPHRHRPRHHQCRVCGVRHRRMHRRGNVCRPEVVAVGVGGPVPVLATGGGPHGDIGLYLHLLLQGAVHGRKDGGTPPTTFPSVPHFVSGRAPVALCMGDGFDFFQQTPVVDMHTLVHLRPPTVVTTRSLSPGSAPVKCWTRPCLLGTVCPPYRRVWGPHLCGAPHHPCAREHSRFHPARPPVRLVGAPRGTHHRWEGPPGPPRG